MIAASIRFDESSIRQILDTELAWHPKASLVDIYKLFFQAHYGPSHIMISKEAFLGYLLGEIRSREGRFEPMIQDIGAGYAYCRVSLDFFDGWSESELQTFTGMVYESRLEDAKPRADWKYNWQSVEAIAMQTVSARESEIEEVRALISSGQIPHHSQEFTRLYNPHYRLLHVQWLDQLKTLENNRNRND